MISISYGYLKKTETVCSYCDGILGKREPLVRIKVRKSGPTPNSAIWRVLCYHPQCFLDVEKDMMNDWFANNPHPPELKPRGRPATPCSDPAAKKRLIQLLRHHKSRGHEEEIVKLEQELRNVCYGLLPVVNVLPYKASNKQLGRPPESTDPLKCRRLKALQRYHRKQGHENRVEELEEEIQSLTKRGQDEN